MPPSSPRQFKRGGEQQSDSGCNMMGIISDKLEQLSAERKQLGELSHYLSVSIGLTVFC